MESHAGARKHTVASVGYDRDARWHDRRRIRLDGPLTARHVNETAHLGVAAISACLEPGVSTASCISDGGTKAGDIAIVDGCVALAHERRLRRQEFEARSDIQLR